jgi:hypothetical protein
MYIYALGVQHSIAFSGGYFLIGPWLYPDEGEIDSRILNSSNNANPS